MRAVGGMPFHMLVEGDTECKCLGTMQTLIGITRSLSFVSMHMPFPRMAACEYLTAGFTYFVDDVLMFLSMVLYISKTCEQQVTLYALPNDSCFLFHVIETQLCLFRYLGIQVSLVVIFEAFDRFTLCFTFLALEDLGSLAHSG